MSILNSLYNTVNKVVDLEPNANPVRGTSQAAHTNKKAKKILKKQAEERLASEKAELEKLEEKKFKKFEDYAKDVNSNDQKIIAREARKYITYYHNSHSKRYPTKNYTNINNGSLSAGQARASLLSVTGMQVLTNLDSAKLSSLIPRVRLFNVTNSGQYEFKFADHQDTNSIISSREMRGTGVGIKSVSIDMIGNSPATADKQFLVNLKVYFSSLEELFKDRGGYSYVDLIKYPESRRDANDTSYTSRDYHKRIKMEYGYADPVGDTLSWTREEIEAIRKSRRIMTLGFIKHEIEHNENGSVVITMEYYGLIEKEAKNIDVLRLSLTPQQRKALSDAESGIRASTSKKGSSAPTDSSEPAQGNLEGLKKTATEIRTEGYQAFMKSIMKDSRIYRVRCRKISKFGSKEEIAKYGIFALAPPQPHKGRGIAQNVELNPIQKDYVVKELGAEEKIISFFYLGDLLDQVVMIAKEHPILKNNFEFAFGSFMFKYLGDNKIQEVPISAIPVSVEQFGKWFKEHIIKKGERTSYDLFSFIHDVLNAFVVETFSAKMQNTSYGLTVESAPSMHSQTFNTTKLVRGPAVPASSFSELLSVGGLNENYINYMYYYGENKEVETDSFIGNASGDASYGIYWLVAGAEKGITKRVKYSKVEQKYLKEARMTQQGVNDNRKLIHNLYKVNVELVGNPIFKPGMIVYITSNSYSQAAAEELGLGGYFQIIKVGNSIENGRFQTEIEGIWLRASPGKNASSSGKKPSSLVANPTSNNTKAPSESPLGKKTTSKPTRRDLKDNARIENDRVINDDFSDPLERQAAVDEFLEPKTFMDEGEK